MGLHGFYNRMVKRGKVGFLPHEMVDFPTTNWVQWKLVCAKKGKELGG